MKNYIRLLLGCAYFLTLGTFAQAQVEARVHQVFDIKNAKSVQLEFPDYHHEVNIKESYSTVIIVEMIITLDKGGPSQIETFINQGRYEVTYTLQDGKITFSRKHPEPTPIVFEGEEVNEYLIYNISVPEYLEY